MIKDMDNKNKNNFSIKSFRYMVVAVGIMIVTALITAILFGRYINAVNTAELGHKNIYEQHYVFVGDDVDSEFWGQVYDSARIQAEKDNIYLEDIKESLKVNYTNEDLLRVAINSSVDGIIYAGGSSKEVVKLIDNAVGQGINICVLHNDIEQSQRQCYVGVNNYELGQIYGSQIIEMTNVEEISNQTISLLVNGEMSEGAANLVVLAIEDSLVEFVEEDSLPEIEVIKINAEDTFSVEENIRNIFVTDNSLPDIMICLEDSYTQCVYQALVDFNRVGEVKVIGYFLNEDILEAIDKQIIYSTVSVDTDEMGKYSVLALEELNEFGYTNSFIPVEMEVISKNKATKLLEKNLTREME